MTPEEQRRFVEMRSLVDQWTADLVTACKDSPDELRNAYLLATHLMNSPQCPILTIVAGLALAGMSEIIAQILAEK